MLKDITLGQYFPGSTLIHRLDPRTKLVGLVCYIVALFLAKSYYSYAFMVLVLACLSALARIRPKTLFSGLKPLLFILLFTGVINLFYGSGEPLVQFWFFKITANGIRTAVFMVLRIMLLVCGTFLLTYTTSPLQLTDGLEKSLGWLKVFRFPVHEIAMMMSIALTFIPVLLEETDRIIKAQQARGADFESGSIIRRAKSLVPILVPLFVSAFRRANDLAIAMESRCYHGGEGRTKMRPLKYMLRDYVAYTVLILYLAAVIVIGILF